MGQFLFISVEIASLRLDLATVLIYYGIFTSSEYLIYENETKLWIAENGQFWTNYWEKKTTQCEKQWKHVLKIFLKKLNLNQKVEFAITIFYIQFASMCVS